MAINEKRLAEAKARIRRSCKRPVRGVYEMGPRSHIQLEKGKWKVGIDEAMWQGRTSPWGVETLRIKVDLWEFHVMRYQIGLEEYYIGLVVNGNKLRRKTYTCPCGRPTARALNDLFRMHEQGIIFTMKSRHTREARSDRRRLK